MGFFEELRSAAGRRGLDFLVVGGHAVNVSGYSRVTADVDILACREDVHAWEQLFAEMGYVPFHRADTFLQLTPPRELSAWPTDLVFVGRETFVQMLALARTVLIEGVEIRVPSVEHLVAMKPGRLTDPAGAVLFFPDWSAMLAEPRRVPFEAIYRRSLEAMQSQRAEPDFELKRLATKSRVEFVL